MPPQQYITISTPVVDAISVQRMRTLTSFHTDLALTECLICEYYSERFLRVSTLTRWDFELYRFDVVRYMNQLDSKKVLFLETGINNTFYGTFRGNRAGDITTGVPVI